MKNLIYFIVIFNIFSCVFFKENTKICAIKLSGPFTYAYLDSIDIFSQNNSATPSGTNKDLYTATIFNSSTAEIHIYAIEKIYIYPKLKILGNKKGQLNTYVIQEGVPVGFMDKITIKPNESKIFIFHLSVPHTEELISLTFSVEVSEIGYKTIMIEKILKHVNDNLIEV